MVRTSAILASALSLSLVTPALAGQGAASDAAKLIGTWRLVAFTSDSASMAMRGAKPTGLLIYDATGHMAAQIAPDRRRPSWPQKQLPTPQQALDAVTGYAAYFGTYKVDAKSHMVTHHREGALNLDLVDYVRKYEFQGTDRLVLLPAERPENRLVWERVK